MKKHFLLALGFIFTFIFTLLAGSVFFALHQDQILAFLLHTQTTEEKEVVHAVPALEKAVYARADLLITLPKEQEMQARSILAEIPASHFQSLKKIVADTDPNARRGLASFKSLYLGVSNIHSAQEFRRVLIHEIGHVLDLGGLTAIERKVDSGFRDGSNVIYESDPSLDFYRLCWENEYTQNGNCGEMDFASRYGSTDAFEDFAESYLLFTENNASFVEMAKQSVVMAEKYDFFAQTVFNGKIPQTGSAQLPKSGRVWDLTEIQ